MDILISMCLIMLGVYTTTTIVLLLLCWRLYKVYTDGSKKLSEVTAKIAEEHNNMAKRLIELQESVNSHEFKLSGSNLHFSKSK